MHYNCIFISDFPDSVPKHENWTRAQQSLSSAWRFQLRWHIAASSWQLRHHCFPPLLTAAQADKNPGFLQRANPDYAHSHRCVCFVFFKWWNKGLSDLNSEHTSDIIFSMYNIWISLSFSSPTWDVTGVKPPLRPSLVKELVVVWVSGWVWTHAVVPCSLAVGWIIDLVFYRLIHLKHRLLLCSFL